MIVSASFLSSNNPPRDIKKLDMTDVDYIHIDVMDGIFVKNKTMPFSEMKKIGKLTSKRLKVHLMAQNAYKYIKDYATLNVETILIHVESDNVLENLQLIKEYGIKAGLAFNPNTEVKDIVPYLPLINEILIMSVFPGSGGQEFISDVVDKISEVKQLIKEYKKECLISIDGGINNNTINYCKNCDEVVSGSYIISSSDFQKKIDELRIN